MTRRTLRLGALGLASALAALGASRLWPARAGTAADDLASVIVTEQPFVRRVTAEGTLRAVTAVEIAVPEAAGMWLPRKLAWLAPDGTAVAAGDVIARFDPSEAEQLLRDARADRDLADVRLREQQLDVATAVGDRDAQATLARQELEQRRRFQATDPLLYSRNDILDAEIEERLATARQAQAERASRSERLVSRANLQLLEIDRRRAALALDHATTALASMVIRAPRDGVLVLRRDDRGDPPKLGTQLSSGNAIGDLPALDAMEAELFVLEVDASGLEVGQPADVVIESRPELAFHGAIRLVDKLAKPRQPGVPVQYVSAAVALDRTDRDAMKPGQRVRATLVTGRRNALVVPLQAVFERAGASIVYRRGEHGWAPVPVELGPATSARVVIASGLAAGDVIALRDPTRAVESPSGPAKAAP
jgi:multidrug efflux pump subunit AcrA (membrane-fusion protein)